MHTCPAATPEPHVGGPITGIGCLTVLIGGMPAATAGDVCTCTGPPDVIISGSSGVLIGGKPAARLGDKTMHGGVIVGGCASVLIGETKGKAFFRKPGLYEDNEGVEPSLSQEEKRNLLFGAIQDSITLLENKLKLLNEDDAKTLEQFEKWFGNVNAKSKKIIKERIKRAIALFKELTEDNFDVLKDLRERRQNYAIVLRDDNTHTFYLGYPFWQAGKPGHCTTAGILIHEISHFYSIGGTKDHKYDDDCINYGLTNPRKALYNADSFRLFIEDQNSIH